MISKNKFFESSIPLLTCPKRVSRGLFFDITSQTEQGVLSDVRLALKVSDMSTGEAEKKTVVENSDLRRSARVRKFPEKYADFVI